MLRNHKVALQLNTLLSLNLTEICSNIRLLHRLVISCENELYLDELEAGKSNTRKNVVLN